MRTVSPSSWNSSRLPRQPNRPRLCEIEQLMDVVAEQKMPAIAMTDHGNLFGAVKFYNAARAKGIQPVVGCEVYVSQQGLKTRSDTDRYNHLILLCEKPGRLKETFQVPAPSQRSNPEKTTSN